MIPELLAPCAGWDTLQAVIEAGADAVYFGGRRFNMRQHRPTLNFEPEEIPRAVAEAHRQGVRVYIVFNNLLVEQERQEACEELAFLAQAEPDALILQDLGVVRMARELGITLPLHASTMMSVHNSEEALALRDRGFTCIVTSRDATLTEVQEIGRRSGLRMEYFAHGDMCIAHGGRCYQSAVTFGESSNRGRCMKPCRWRYDLVHTIPGQLPRTHQKGAMLLARKDMCLYDHLEHAVAAGIHSLKIEGRARSADYLRPLVGLYRRQLDRLAHDPRSAPIPPEDRAQLEALRVREVCTCAALGRPGAESVDPTGDREPRIFSEQGQEHTWPPETRPATLTGAASPPALHVRVRTAAQALAASAAGAQRVYLDQPEPVDLEAELFLASPAITTDAELAAWLQVLEAPELAGRWQGVLAGNLGVLRAARAAGIPQIVADFTLNVANADAAHEVAREGAASCTAALELSVGELASLVASAPLPVEALLHGTLPGMLLDHCPIHPACAPRATCGHSCQRGRWELVDLAGGRHTLLPEAGCRLRLTTAHDLCMLPWLDRLVALHPAALRIEGLDLEPGALGEVVAIYRRRLAGGGEPGDLERLRQLSPRPLGAGAYPLGCRHRSPEGVRLEQTLVDAARHA